MKGPRWFRLMYAYPRYLTEEMLDVLASDERFCPYIDIPLQHISDPMLSAMARGVTKAQTVALLDLIAKKLRGGAIRTTFITGFPGETEQDFREMADFVAEGRFTHAGVFLYSTEPLTPASKMPDTIPLAEKKARRDAVMLAQREVSRRRTASRVGASVDVMVDGLLSGEAPVKGVKIIGRSQLEAPEVDGMVFLKEAAALKSFIARNDRQSEDCRSTGLRRRGNGGGGLNRWSVNLASSFVPNISTTTVIYSAEDCWNGSTSRRTLPRLRV